jgi:hypothetical protein
MAVKKPIRRKRTRGRNFAGVEKAFRSYVKAFQSGRWTKSPVMPVAVAFVALVGVLLFAYAASTPQPTNGERSAARAEAPATPTPERARPAAAPATEQKPRAAAEAIAADEAYDGVTTGPTPTVVTLTGCLVRSDKDFRLNDTTGVNAPKSRSWKSGFLAKRSASISIVPASSGLPLSSHVGERVTVSGTLIERQMQVRTLRRVSSSCDGGDPGPRVTA